jgi:ABC-type uncharacterized transport system permease subunit
MVNILEILAWLLPLLYLATLARYAHAFFLRIEPHPRGLLLPAALAVHVLFLVLLGRYLGRMVPVTNYEVLSVMAAGLAAVHWVVQHTTRDRRTGVFVILAAFVLQYTASVFLIPADLRGGPTGPVVSAYWGHLHMIPALVAYVAFTLSAIYALLHLLALRDLRHHRFGLLFDRLPPLETLAKMNWHTLLAGFVFMTAAIASGAAMAAAGRADAAAINSKTFMKMFASLAGWVIFACTITGKFTFKWDAARISRYTMIGYAVVLAMLVASIALSAAKPL